MASLSEISPPALANSDHPASPEEQDSLERSTKKIDEPASQSKTFRDTLVDGKRGQLTNLITMKEILEANQASNMVADGMETQAIPKVRFTKEIMKKLCEPWQNALIIKLLGKTISYQALNQRIQQDWRIEGEFELIDIDCGYYIVKFAEARDSVQVLNGGPYKIFGHYLAVQKWKPNFRSCQAKAPTTAVWVHFPRLPMEQYQEPILMFLGNQVGKALHVDRSTLLASKGRFARVCVEIDLSKPLIPCIDLVSEDPDGIASNDLNDKLQVVYEGLHVICFGCGEYGHKKENCRYNVVIQPSTEQAAGQIPAGSTAIEQATNPAPATQQSNRTRTARIPITWGNNGEIYGAWMLPNTRKKNHHGRRAQNNGQKGTGRNNGHKDSTNQTQSSPRNIKDSVTTTDPQASPQTSGLEISPNRFAVLPMMEEDLNTKPKTTMLAQVPSIASKIVQPNDEPSPIDMDQDPLTLSPQPNDGSKIQGLGRGKQKLKDKAAKTIGPLHKTKIQFTPSKPYTTPTRKPLAVLNPPPTMDSGSTVILNDASTPQMETTTLSPSDRVPQNPNRNQRQALGESLETPISVVSTNPPSPTINQ